jgi:hypothetical protein
MESSPEEKQKKKKRGRGKDTLFRISSRNQIELIAIADQKSNLIIGICVVLISLLLAILGSGLHFKGDAIITNPNLMVPLTVLLLSLLAAAIFAILAAKPQIIKGRPGSVHSILFFQNIYAYSQEEYLNEMHNMIDDDKLVFDQLIVDMYYNGIVLHQKYKLLNAAYVIFVVGLVLSVVVFGVTNLI